MIDDQDLPPPDEAPPEEELEEVKPKRRKKVAEPEPVLLRPDTMFERIGMGYRLSMEDIKTELTVDRLKVEGGHLSGDLTVRSEFPGARTYDGVLHAARVNLTATATRSSVGKFIASRVAGGRESALDWIGFVDELFTRVMAAERDTEPMLRTNGFSHPDSGELLLKPFLPMGMPTSLYADGMAGKSVLALALAITVATGHAVIKGMPPRVSGPVLYLDWETDFGTVDVRQKALSAGAGLPPSTILYRRCKRPLADLAEEIARIVTGENVALLIVDSVTMAMGAGREGGDAADSTLRFYGALASIGDPVTVLCIDHVAKGSDGTKPYGSVYRSNLARATWYMRKMREDELGGSHVVLTHEKHNTTKKLGPVGLIIRFEDASASGQPLITITQEGLSESIVESSNVALADRIAALILHKGHALEGPEIARELRADPAQVRVRLNQSKDRFTKVLGGWKAEW